MTLERKEFLHKKIEEADTFDKLCEVAEVATEKELKELQEFLKEEQGFPEKTFYNTNELKTQVAMDFAMLKNGKSYTDSTVWLLKVTTPIATNGELLKEQQFQSIEWKPFVFLSKETALKFFERNRTTDNRDYRVYLDLVKQCQEKGLKLDFAKEKWAKSYELIERPIL